MEIIVNVNSYMTLEEAKSIASDELDANDLTVWNSLDDTEKTRLILKSTRKIENLVFIGHKVGRMNTQPLSFPRYIQLQLTECPYEIKVGIIKQGIRELILSDSEEKKLQEKGVKSYNINGASISFGDIGGTVRLTNGLYTDIYSECFEKWMV